MKTCDEIRLENLKALIVEAGGIERLAAKYGCTPSYIKQMERGYKDSKSGSPKGIGDQSARMLEQATGKERGWMDHDHQHDQMLAEPSAAYTVDRADERFLLGAYRRSSDQQREIVLAWARANSAHTNSGANAKSSSTTKNTTEPTDTVGDAPT